MLTILYKFGNDGVGDKEAGLRNAETSSDRNEVSRSYVDGNEVSRSHVDGNEVAGSNVDRDEVAGCEGGSKGGT